MEGLSALPRLLSTFKSGERGVVNALASHGLTPKLVEMGVFTGKEVEVLFRAPFGGPIAIDVEGYILSLREDEAGLVLVDQKTN